MGQHDFKVVKYPGPARTFIAEDRTTSSVTAQMEVGEPVKGAGATTNYVIPLATGDPEVGTDEFVGVVCRKSDEASAVDGDCEVITCIPARTVLRAKATTSGNMDTQSELNGLLLDWICADVTAVSGTNGTFTLDENEGSDPNVHGFQVVDGDIVAYTLDVIVHAMASIAGPYY